MTLTKTGYAVQLKRKDGTLYLAGSGMLPLVHHYRKYAVQLKRDLAKHRLKGKVVKVRYAEPEVV